MSEIEFTPEKLKKFEELYNTTIEAGEETFTFEGREVLVDYAKYMIEYLDDKLRGRGE
jgi:hypothetical protein